MAVVRVGTSSCKKQNAGGVAGSAVWQTVQSCIDLDSNRDLRGEQLSLTPYHLCLGPLDVPLVVIEDGASFNCTRRSRHGGAVGVLLRGRSLGPDFSQTRALLAAPR